MADADRQTDRPIKVFISYARNDLPFAERLVDNLRHRGVDARIDNRDLPFAREWQEELVELVRWCDTVLYVVSDHSIASHWCHWELAQCEKYGKRIGPIICKPVADDLIPPGLAKLQYISFVPPFDYDQQVAKLVHQLGLDIDWIRQHGNYAAAARSWTAADAQGRDSFLLRGAALDMALQWLEQRSPSAPAPTAEQLAFLQASQRAIEIEQEQRILAQQRQIRESEIKLANSLVMRGQMLANQDNWGQAKASYRDAFQYFDKHRVSPLPAVAGYAQALDHSPDPALWYLGADADITALAASPNGRFVAAGTRSGRIFIWEAASGRLHRTLTDGHASHVCALAFDRQSQVLCSVSENFLVCRNRIDTGDTINRFDNAPHVICAAQITDDGERLACLSYLRSENKAIAPLAGSMRYHLHSFELGGGDPSSSGYFDLDVRSFAALPAGRGILLGVEDGAVLITHDAGVKRLSMFEKLDDAQAAHPLVYTVHGECVCVSRSGRYALLCYSDFIAEQWDLLAAKPIWRKRMGADSIVAAEYLAIDPQREASYFAVARASGAVDIVQDGTTLSVHPDAEAARAIRFLPQADTLLAASGRVITASSVHAAAPLQSTFHNADIMFGFDVGYIGGAPPLLMYQEPSEDDHSMLLFDGRTGDVLNKVKLPVEGKRVFAIDPGLIGIRDVNVLNILDLNTGDVRHKIELAPAGSQGGTDASMSEIHLTRTAAADRRSGRVAVCEGDDTIRVIHAPSGQTLRRIKDRTASSDGNLQFLPGGELLTFAGYTSVSVWSVESGERVSFAEFDQGERQKCMAVATSAAGPFLATAHVDGRIRIWRAGSSKLELTASIYAHDGSVQALTHTADGNVLVSGGFDGKIKLWNVEDGAEIYRITAGPPIFKLQFGANGDLFAGVMGDPSVYGEIEGVILHYDSAQQRIVGPGKVRGILQETAARPPTPDECLTLARWYALQRFRDTAEKYFELAGNSAEVRQELAHLLGQSGETEAASSIYDDLKKANKGSNLWLNEAAAGVQPKPRKAPWQLWR